MKYAIPKETILNDGQGYEKKCYLAPSVLNGVVDENYPEYSSSTTYNTGDYVIVSALKTIYKCAADNVQGVYPPSDPTKWVDFGFINSYRMLAVDEQIGEKTEGQDIYMELDFSRSTTIAFINTDFEEVTLQQFDGDGNLVKEVSLQSKDISCSSFAQYFLDEAKRKTRIIEFNFSWIGTSTLKVQFTGETKIGSMVVGKSQELGITLYGTTLTFQDKSVVHRDEITGFRKVLRHGNIRVLEAKIATYNSDFNQIAQKLTQIVGKNVLWIPTNLDKFSEMINIAYIEKAPLPINNPKINETSITLIGVV